MHCQTAADFEIVCLGLSYKTSPLELREQLALHSGIRQQAANDINWPVELPATELVVLATCNRIEFYTVTAGDSIAALEARLSELCHLPLDQLRSHSYLYRNLDAARHLFSVASGLESLVIGETQILGQVVRALEIARQRKTAGPILNRLFQSAIHAGKRARAETNISRHPASVASLAASLAARSTHGALSQACAVVIGAGEMAELAVRALSKRGARQILIVNRTLINAQAIANRWAARAVALDSLDAALGSADIVISSTGAPHVIVPADRIRRAMATRPDRPLCLIDIAMPRDIDPAAAAVPRVALYDIDRLSADLGSSAALGQQEIPRVSAILADEIAEFSRYLESLDAIALIAAVHQQAERIRSDLLEKSWRRLPDLSTAERTGIEVLTRALVKQLLHSPISQLRAYAPTPSGTTFTTVARQLFGVHRHASADDNGHSDITFDTR